MFHFTTTAKRTNGTARTFFKRIFGIPSSHQWKRWLRLQQVMNRKRWFELDMEKNGPLSLWDFSFPEDAQSIHSRLLSNMKYIDGNSSGNNGDSSSGTWRLIDDSMTIGGYSDATVQLIQSPQEYQQLLLQQQEDQLDMSQSTGLNIEKNMTTSESDPYNNSVSTISTTTTTTTLSPPIFVPFVRWQGTLDTRVNNANHNHHQTNSMEQQQQQERRRIIQRSGFCSLLSPHFPTIDLGGRYNGLEITCRSDGRPYTLHLKVQSYIPDDLYQCVLHIPPTTTTSKTTTSTSNATTATTSTTTKHNTKTTSTQKESSSSSLLTLSSSSSSSTEDTFDRVVVLFQQHFIVTGRGRPRTTQRQLDQRINIQSMGFTLMDGMDGPFVFDLARIRAINYDDSGVIGTVD
jgi:Complex I intermediate-associated protein 30 (CIA30)